jgi:hypothetical protein
VKKDERKARFFYEFQNKNILIMNGLYFLPFVGRNREGGGRGGGLGEARPIRKQVFLPVPENRVFCS